MNTVISKISLLVLLVLAGLVATSCEDTYMSLSDTIVTTEKNIGGYTKIEVSDAFDVEVNLGQVNEFISIVANENLHPYIETTIANNTLIVSMKKSVRYRGDATLKVFVNARDVNEYKLSGATRLSLGTKLISDRVSIEASGASDFQGLLEVNIAQITVTGASKTWFMGKTNNLELQLDGASKFEAFDMPCKVANLRISGASTALVHVTEELKSNVSGASKLYYKGSPLAISNNISGGSTITKRD